MTYFLMKCFILDNLVYNKEVIKRGIIMTKQEFIKQIETAPPAKGDIIEKDITVVTVNKDKVRIRIWVENIGGETNNFAYILRSERI